MGGATLEGTRFEALLGGIWPEADGLSGQFAAASRAARAVVPADGPRATAIRDVTAGVAAPMLVSYVLWVLFDARRRGLERLYFLSRDGQVLLEIARALAPRLGLDLDCRYLFASRQAWVRNLVTLGSPSEQNWLWYGCKPGEVTLEGLLRRLGGAGPETAAVLASAGFPLASWTEPLDAAASDRLRAVFSSEAFAASRDLARAAARRRLLAYLAQEGVLDGVAFGVVDLGWIGTLHTALCDLLTAERQGVGAPEGYLFGVEAGGSACWSPRRHGYQFDLNRDPEAGLFLPIADQRAYLEVFCAADHGTLVGYREGAGGIEPELVAGWGAKAAAWGLGAMRATLRAACDALDLEGVGSAAAAGMRAPIQALLEAFWTDPTPSEARAWGSFPLDLGEGHGSRPTPLAAPYAASDLWRLLGRRARLKKAEHFWVEGALAMSPPPLRNGLRVLRRSRRGLARLAGRG